MTGLVRCPLGLVENTDLFTQGEKRLVLKSQVIRFSFGVGTKKSIDKYSWRWSDF